MAVTNCLLLNCPIDRKGYKMGKSLAALAHDVLNLDDLEPESFNEGKLMYPAIATYESISMDEFIEQSHELFETISSK